MDTNDLPALTMTPHCGGMEVSMKKEQPKTKEKKFLAWMKEKRVYIVLLCCIMAIGSAYYFISARQNTPKTVDTPKTDIDYTQPNAAPTEVAKQEEIPPTEKPTATQEPNLQAATPTPEQETEPLSEPAVADLEVEEAKAAPPREKLSYPTNGEVLVEFTGENLVFSKTLGDWRAHSGIDLKAELGSPVKAAGNGIVEDIYTDETMGITIIIDHQNGMKSIYQNLSTDAMVQKGQEISLGEVISGVGDTALYETGEVGHLHFEITIDGENVNPLDWLTA